MLSVRAQNTWSDRRDLSRGSRDKFHIHTRPLPIYQPIYLSIYLHVRREDLIPIHLSIYYLLSFIFGKMGAGTRMTLTELTDPTGMAAAMLCLLNGRMASFDPGVFCCLHIYLGRNSRVLPSPNQLRFLVHREAEVALTELSFIILGMRFWLSGTNICGRTYTPFDSQWGVG